jgi:ribosomal protein L37AE/L43A
MADEDEAPIEVEAEVLKAVLELQAQTACRKCKAKTWEQRPGFGEAHGGDRVGIFVTMGPRTDRVAVASWKCKGCGANFARPVYSKAQLAKQQYPAIQLDVKAEAAGEAAPETPPKAKTAKKTKKHTGGNGKA